jgi:hypothetical protein
MPKHTQWIRWEVGYRIAPKTLRLRSPIAVLGFPAFCAWAKGQGCLEEPIPHDDLDADTLSFILGNCDEADAQAAWRDWIRVGYVVDLGDSYIIPAAAKWQPDSTAAERKRRQREREQEERDVTNVTVTDRDNRASRGPDLTGLELTGAERTDQDPLSTSAPPKPDGFDELLAEVNATLGRKLRATADKRKIYKTRLKSFTHEELMRVPRGAKNHPNYNGKKSDGVKYYDWLNLFRSDERVEQLLNADDSPPISPDEIEKYSEDYWDWEWTDYVDEGMTYELWLQRGPPRTKRGNPRIPNKYAKGPPA